MTDIEAGSGFECQTSSLAWKKEKAIKAYYLV